MEQNESATADLKADRQAFLESIENDKVRGLIDSLGPYPYKLQTLFPKTSGFGVRRHIKRRIQMLKAVESRFDHLLYPDEHIDFVTHGLFNSLIEQIFLGLVAYMINRTLFLFTNYRVILINATGRYRPKQMQWQIPYEEISRFKPGGFVSSNVVFKLRDGKKYKFSGVPQRDRKALRSYVQEQVNRVEREEFSFPHYRSRDPLCPACSTPVAPGERQCSTCTEQFIDPKIPALMSLMLPCLGDFYLGHRFLGSIELITYIVIALYLISGLRDEGMTFLPVVLITLAIEHGFDAIMTYYIAKKGVTLQRTAWRSH